MPDSVYFAISTDSLTKTYKGEGALKFLDLKVTRNSIFGFLGPNEAGKSASIKLRPGLLKPDSGTCTVFGQYSLECRGNAPHCNENSLVIPFYSSYTLED